MRCAHRVAIVAFGGQQPLDLVGPHEVFSIADKVLADEGRNLRYDVAVVSRSGGPVRGESGLDIGSEPWPAPTEVDTVIVPGGDGANVAANDPDLRAWLLAAATTARIASVCSGAFVLAGAGLLDDRRATTHWARAASLARRHPRISVDSDPIFICDRGVWTSAGVTAGIDLALAMVEQDSDATVAQTVARWLVMFARRPGGQSQFATPVWTEMPTKAPIREVVEFIQANPAADLSLTALAARAHLSVRHLQRLFTDEIGETPSAFVERIRVESARRLLESMPITVAAAARTCGFGTPETLRRAFVRRVGVSPDDYRKRFALVGIAIDRSTGPLLPNSPIPDQRPTARRNI